ncbi:MAG: LysM peptidoglycan-binding domain-containing protein [Raineya sp.]|jgi:nucleoid-associated protein YgaU|nr:LysM peptidoglycan-binding domain-containing protein [Raineya sp.]
MFDLNDVAAQALKKQVEDAVSGKIQNLEVLVNGTEVTVRGDVQSADDKQSALALVQNVSGISKIISGISVLDEVKAAEEAANTYTVKAGDTLWAIAQNQLGNGADYMKIYEANKDVIGSNPDLIKVGMELKIPK